MEIRLETPRLSIRELQQKDILFIWKNMNNPKITRWMDTPSNFTKEDAINWINNCSYRAEEKPRKYYSGIIEQRPNKILIGELGLDIHKKKGELMYWISPAYQRQGFASEAVISFLNFTFEQLGLEQITANIYEKNFPSKNLVEKLGFKCIQQGDKEVYTLNKNAYSNSF